MEISDKELENIISRVAVQTATNVLQLIGKLDSKLSKSHVQKRIGRKTYNAVVKSGQLTEIKINGRYYIDSAQFLAWEAKYNQQQQVINQKLAS